MDNNLRSTRASQLDCFRHVSASLVVFYRFSSQAGMPMWIEHEVHLGFGCGIEGCSESCGILQYMFKKCEPAVVELLSGRLTETKLKADWGPAWLQ